MLNNPEPPRRNMGKKGAAATASALLLLAGSRVAMAGTPVPATGLMVSANANHVNPLRLSHQPLGGVVYVYMGNAGADKIQSVTYYLDDPTGQRQPAVVATVNPYPLGEGGLDTTRLAPGAHTLLADVRLKSGQQEDLFARFVVTANTGSAVRGSSQGADAGTSQAPAQVATRSPIQRAPARTYMAAPAASPAPAAAPVTRPAITTTTLQALTAPADTGGTSGASG